MIKNMLLIIILLSFVLGLSACNKDIASTDLKYIEVDDTRLGKAIVDIDFNRYTNSDRFEEKENTYNFEEISIGTDKEDKTIKEIQANIADVNLSINKITKFTTIEDVTNVLGEDYKDYWYDKEQGLKSKLYIDFENKIRADFVYNIYENKLIWIIVSKDI